MENQQAPQQPQAVINNQPAVPAKPPKKKSRVGKKILLVLVILILAAGAGFAGYIYADSQGQKETDAKVSELQNQINDLKANDQKKLGEDSEASLSESFTVKDSKNTFTIMHPKSWGTKISTRTLEGLPAGWISQQGSITSPAGEIAVGLDTGITGIGGACLDEEAGKIKTLKITPLPQAPGYSYVQYSGGGSSKDSPGSILVYGAYVVKDSVAKETQVGDSFCDVYLTEMLQMGDDVGLASFMVNSKTIDALRRAGKDPTAAQIETFFTSKEFETAKAILLTLKIN